MYYGGPWQARMWRDGGHLLVSRTLLKGGAAGAAASAPSSAAASAAVGAAGAAAGGGAALSSGGACATRRRLGRAKGQRGRVTPLAGCLPRLCVEQVERERGGQLLWRGRAVGQRVPAVRFASSRAALPEVVDGADSGGTKKTANRWSSVLEPDASGRASHYSARIDVPLLEH